MNGTGLHADAEEDPRGSDVETGAAPCGGTPPGSPARVAFSKRHACDSHGQLAGLPLLTWSADCPLFTKVQHKPDPQVQSAVSQQQCRVFHRYCTLLREDKASTEICVQGALSWLLGNQPALFGHTLAVIEPSGAEGPSRPFGPAQCPSPLPAKAPCGLPSWLAMGVVDMGAPLSPAA